MEERIKYEANFKDAPWYTRSKDELIVVVGAGGIGSSSLYCLSKTVPAKYYIVDHDKVELHNCSTQFFKHTQIEKLKVLAIRDNCKEQSPHADITPLQSKFTSGHVVPIMIAALDNMKTRREVFEKWKSYNDRELLLEGRLRANLYEVYAVQKGDEERYEATLFDDNEVDEGPCTFKQTAYFGMLIGARITHLLVNYLMNKYATEPVCSVPFKTVEIGEMFYFNAE